MSVELIGLRVSVLLNPPYGKRIEGRVSSVQNKQLFLEDVHFVENGSTAQCILIPGQDIADLDVLPAQLSKLIIPQQQAPVSLTSRNGSNANIEVAEIDPAQDLITPSSRTVTPLSGILNGQSSRNALQTPRQNLADPAIVSYAKPLSAAVPQELAALPSVQISDFPKSTPSENQPTVSATLSKPFNNLSITETASKPVRKSVADGHTEPLQAQAFQRENFTAGSRGQRRKQNKQILPQAAADDESSPEIVRSILVDTAPNPQTGWRQTPILQEVAAKGPQAPTQTARKRREKSKLKKQSTLRAEDGFLTEDTTDVQALEDFDFAANLSKFDKKAVFEQLRTQDTTADEDLLVNHNRLPRPGTFQGTKLHPFENVIDRPRKDSREIFDSDEDYDTVDALGSRPPHRIASRSSSTRRVPLRSTSKMSDSSHQHEEGRRTQGRDSYTGTGSSPRPQGKPALKYLSGRVTPCLWPDDLREAEEYALSDEYCLTEDIIAENAGRAIADLALSTISPDGRRFAPGNHNTRPVVVVLVWDGRTAARGLAAGRHLQNRGIRVIASAADKRMVKYEDEDTPMAAQLYRFKGSLMSWEQTSQYLKTLDAPPELIIDALSGTKDLMSNLINQEEPSHVKDATFQMMAWANKSRASCLAIDCPFGVNPSTGQVRVHEGEPAEIRAKVVACCGAPVTGILAALQIRHTEGSPDDWRIHVCDTGINSALKALTRERMGRGQGRGIAFGAEWMVKVQFDSLSS